MNVVCDGLCVEESSEAVLWVKVVADVDTDSVVDAVAIESVVVTVGASSEAVLCADCEVIAVICVGLWVSEPSDGVLWVKVVADVDTDCVAIESVVFTVGETLDDVLWVDVVADCIVCRIDCVCVVVGTVCVVDAVAINCVVCCVVITVGESSDDVLCAGCEVTTVICVDVADSIMVGINCVGVNVDAVCVVDSVRTDGVVGCVLVTVGESSGAVLCAEFEVTTAVCDGLCVSEPSDTVLWVDVADSVVDTDCVVEAVATDGVVFCIVFTVDESSDAVLRVKLVPDTVAGRVDSVGVVVNTVCGVGAVGIDCLICPVVYSDAVLCADCELTALICVGLCVSETSDVVLWDKVVDDSIMVGIDCVLDDVAIDGVVGCVAVTGDESSDAVWCADFEVMNVVCIGVCVDEPSGAVLCVKVVADSIVDKTDCVGVVVDTACFVDSLDTD